MSYKPFILEANLALLATLPFCGLCITPTPLLQLGSGVANWLPPKLYDPLILFSKLIRSLIPPATPSISLRILSITLCPSDPALIASILLAMFPSIPPLNTLPLKPPVPIQAHTCPGTMLPI